MVGTSTVKKIKYYAIKSGKSTMLVKQSLLSKTKPKAAKPSSKPSTNSNHNSSNHSGVSMTTNPKYFVYNDKGQKVATQDNGLPSNVINYAWDDFIRCNMPGVKPHHGDKCVGYKMVNGKKKNIYYNKANNKTYVGIAQCHTDDFDMMNEKTGCNIAFLRAKIKAFQSYKND